MDSLNVQWYKSSDTITGEGDEAIGELIDIKDTGILKFVPPTAGFYYAKVHLTRNTDTKTAISGTWAVL
jgi:hypothetical protein